MERFFHDFRRGARVKTGHNPISKFLRSVIADTPLSLVGNLDNPQYLKVLLNGHTSLEDCFAQIDTDLVRKELEAAQQSPERVPLKMRQLVLNAAFPDALRSLFRKRASGAKSNRVL